MNTKRRAVEIRNSEHTPDIGYLQKAADYMSSDKQKPFTERMYVTNTMKCLYIFLVSHSRDEKTLSQLFGLDTHNGKQWNSQQYMSINSCLNSLKWIC